MANFKPRFQNNFTSLLHFVIFWLLLVILDYPVWCGSQPMKTKLAWYPAVQNVAPLLIKHIRLLRHS